MGVSKDLVDHLQGILNNGEQTSRCICNEAVASLETFTYDPALVDQMSRSDFNIDDFFNGPHVLFLIPSDEDDSLSTILGSIISMTYRRLIYLLNSRNKDELDTRLNIIIEEAGSVFVKTLPEMMAASRSRNIRVTYCVQSFTQLLSLYDKQAYSILENTRDRMFLGGYDEVISPMFINLAGIGSDGQPLLTFSDLNNLQRGSEAITLIDDLPVITSKLYPDYEIYPQDWPECYPKVREKEEKPPISTITDLVLEESPTSPVDIDDDHDICSSKHSRFLVGPDTKFLDYLYIKTHFIIQAGPDKKRKVNDCFNMRHCMAICDITSHLVRDIPIDILYHTMESCFKELSVEPFNDIDEFDGTEEGLDAAMAIFEVFDDIFSESD